MHYIEYSRYYFAYAYKFFRTFFKIQKQLENPQAVIEENILIDLVNALRPSDPHDTEEIEQKYKPLLIAYYLLLPLQPFTNLLLRLINQYKQVSLYADSGILSLDGFWNQLGQRLGGHFLPLIEDASQLKILIGKIFYLESDSIWLNNVDDKDWATLFGLIGQSNSNVDEKHAIQREMIKAITVLSYRISGIGLYPEFINAQPELTEYESPFLVQNREIIEFIEKYKNRIFPATTLLCFHHLMPLKHL